MLLNDIGSSLKRNGKVGYIMKRLGLGSIIIVIRNCVMLDLIVIDILECKQIIIVIDHHN